MCVLVEAFKDMVMLVSLIGHLLIHLIGSRVLGKILVGGERGPRKHSTSTKGALFS